MRRSRRSRPNRALGEPELRALLSARIPRRPGRNGAPSKKPPAELSKRYRAWYLVAARCGPRWEEQSKLRIEHFDLVGLRLTLTADVTKTGKPRTIPLWPEVAEAVRAVIPAGSEPRNRVFRGKPDRRTAGGSSTARASGRPSPRT